MIKKKKEKIYGLIKKTDKEIEKENYRNAFVLWIMISSLYFIYSAVTAFGDAIALKYGNGFEGLLLIILCLLAFFGGLYLIILILGYLLVKKDKLVEIKK